MKFRVIKNKVAIPFKEASTNLIYGKGIDRADELFQVALKLGHIHQGGAWFTYVDKETGEVLEFNGDPIKTQGRDKFIELIRETPLLFGELEEKIYGAEEGLEEVEADEMSDEEKEAFYAESKAGE